MSSKKEYRVGEIFRNNGETFQCVFTDQSEGVYCLNCEAGNQLCETLICHEKERSDKKNVHFIRVTEPEDGMMFRASDGNLYRLFIDIDPFDYGSCACDGNGSPSHPSGLETKKS